MRRFHRYLNPQCILSFPFCSDVGNEQPEKLSPESVPPESDVIVSEESQESDATAADVPQQQMKFLPGETFDEYVQRAYEELVQDLAAQGLIRKVRKSLLE